ncbi:MAG TPA: hypothetical protein VHO29_19165 [Marmoricola sp.]|nr:hypothetical protein [Marmoricola sp.]
MREPPGPDIEVTGLGARSWGRLATGLIAIGLAAFLGVELRSAASVPAGVRWTFLGVGALFVVLGVLLLVEAAQGRRPLELRGNTLIIAGDLRRRRIPLQEVTGVGLLFQWVLVRNGLPAGWYLTVWDKDEKPHMVEECALLSHWTQKDYMSGRGPSESTETLATSDAGQMAKRIYGRVFSVQGSRGPLATQRAQMMRNTTVWTRDINTYACWSPDGELRVFAEEAPQRPTES